MRTYLTPLVRLSAVAALLFALAAAQLCASEPEFPAPLTRMELNNGDAVVFLGDSITHQCLYTQYVEDFFYTRFPGSRFVFHNAGVGGARAWDALERFDRDVAACKPKYVTVLLGMNDGSYQPFKQEIFDTYQQDMTTLIERIKAAGATPILMTPTMFDSRAARMRDQRRPRAEGTVNLYNSVLTYYGTWLRELATENGYGFVDMWGPLNNLTLEQRKTDPAFTMIKDAVHPDPPGQLVMAYAIVEDLGLRGPVSSIRLVRSDRGRPQSRATGGQLSDLTWNDDSLSFAWQAESLPWVVPADAQIGAKLLRLGHRASAERLEVHGLPAGPYELTIDGKSVGVYPSASLARHIELQENTATPQYQQALQVAELNSQRNAGPIRSLRNEWSVFQQFARLKKQASETPDDAKLQEQVAALEQRLQGMDDRIAEHERGARELEDRIFEINQPQPRAYKLQRVTLAPVEGTITLDGKPVANATVTFAGENGRESQGVTDESGQFQLKTGSASGAVPGKYQIAISAPGVPEKFSRSETSGLDGDVAPEQNKLSLDLRSN
jgi:lysophospholipase L1-like esterase